MLGLKLNHVSKRGPKPPCFDFHDVVRSDRPFWITVQCRFNAGNFLTDIYITGELWGVFCGSASDWYSAWVPVIIYVTSYNIGTRYKGNLLYIVWLTKMYPKSLFAKNNWKQIMSNFVVKTIPTGGLVLFGFGSRIHDRRIRSATTRFRAGFDMIYLVTFIEFDSVSVEST